MDFTKAHYLALGCINSIDDLLEYRYQNHTVEELREAIYRFINDYTNAIEELGQQQTPPHDPHTEEPTE